MSQVKRMCIAFLAVKFVVHASALTYENMTLLKTNLLNGYDVDMLPLNNQADALNLTVGMSLYRLLEVDTVKGVIYTVLTLDCFWYDERITWTPSDYGGIQSVRIQQNQVWTPSLTLGQPVEFKAIGEKWMQVIYQSNGYAYWRPGGVIESTCPIDMKYWPFDEQTCEISFFPYGYWNGEVRVNVTGLDVTFYFPNGEWSMETTFAKVRNSYGLQEALFKITIKRLAVFYILTLIVPLFGLGILTGFVFLLPSDSGERVSYAITILLALTVFLTIISDNIPKLSDPVPLLCIFLLLAIGMSSLTTLAVILNLALYHRSPDKPVGPWYAAIVRLTRCRSNRVRDDEILREQLNEMNKREHATFNKKMTTITSISTTEAIKNIKRQNSNQPMAFADDNEDVITWKDVSYAIDAILCVTMTVVQVFPALGLLIVLVTQ